MYNELNLIKESAKILKQNQGADYCLALERKDDCLHQIELWMNGTNSMK